MKIKNKGTLSNGSWYVAIKGFILLFLIFLIGLNLISSKNNPNKLTKIKTQFFNLDGSSNFIGQLNLWYFFAQNNDWTNATKFDPNLTQTQLFTLNNKPEKLLQKVNELKNKNNKDAQDYLTLAKIQSTLGLQQDAVESIKQAHQIDPIRPDLDQLFYSVTN